MNYETKMMMLGNRRTTCEVRGQRQVQCSINLKTVRNIWLVRPGIRHFLHFRALRAWKFCIQTYINHPSLQSDNYLYINLKIARNIWLTDSRPQICSFLQSHTKSPGNLSKVHKIARKGGRANQRGT